MADLLERLSSALADRYAVESEIGRGGMATVYLANDVRHERQVAVKVMHPELSATVGAERFLHEIRTVAGLNHPHILAVHDSGEADGLLYYVMPYVEGESLRQRLDQKRQLSIEETVRIGVEVADALDYAHRQGIIHRDIKPGNILLSEGHAVLADFGIARAVSVAGQERVTRTGMGVGTPLYASPEQATADETLDGRTDIYSLGIVLYEMLAGEVPLGGSTPQLIQAKRLSQTPTPLPVLRETVPPLLDRVIARALAKVPADRFETAKEMSNALMASSMDATPVASLDLSATPGLVAAGEQRAGRTRRAIWLVAALAALIAGAAGAWYAGQRIPGSEGEPSPEQAGAIESTEIRLTNTGDIEAAAISPGGQEVAWCRLVAPYDPDTRLTVMKLMVAPVAEPEAARDLGTFDYCAEPRWLDDGSKIVARAYDTSGRISTVSVSRHGGDVRPLACLGATQSDALLEEFVVSPDGTRCASRPWGDDQQLIVRSSDGTLPPDTIMLEGEHEYLVLLDWLPEDRLSFETGTSPGFGTIWTMRPDGSDRDSIVSFENRFTVKWSTDGRALYYMPGVPGTSDVMRVDIGADGNPEGEPSLLLPQLDGAPSLSISADGRRAILTRGAAQSRIVRIAADPENGSTTGVVTTVVDWTEGLSWMALSKSGEWIAYASPEGRFKVPTAGGEPTLLDLRGGSFGDWSPDDQFLVYVDDWKDTARLWIQPVEGGPGAAMVEGEVGLVRPRWQGPYLVAGPPGLSREFRVLDSLEAWNFEQQEWVPLLAGDLSAIDLRRNLRARGIGVTPIDSITQWIGPRAVSPDGQRLLVDWGRTLDGSRATDSTVYATTWLFSADGSDRTRIPTIIGDVLAWTNDGLYVRKGSGIYFQDLDGNHSRLLLELPELHYRSRVQLRQSQPMEAVVLEVRETRDAWLIENFDPHLK